MAGTPEKMLEHLLETGVDSKNEETSGKTTMLSQILVHRYVYRVYLFSQRVKEHV